MASIGERDKKVNKGCLKVKKRCQILNKKYLQSRDEIGFFLTSDNEVKSPLWDYRPKGLSPCREQETKGFVRVCTRLLEVGKLSHFF